MSGKFSQHDVREQVFQYLHFCKCGLTNSKLAVLVSQYAQSVGVEKDKILTRSVGKTVNADDIDPSPLLRPPPHPQSPISHIQNPDSLVLGPSQHYQLLHMFYGYTLGGLGCFLWGKVDFLKFDDDVEHIQNLVYKEKKRCCIYPCMTFICIVIYELF